MHGLFVFWTCQTKQHALYSSPCCRPGGCAPRGGQYDQTCRPAPESTVPCREPVHSARAPLDCSSRAVLVPHAASMVASHARRQTLPLEQQAGHHCVQPSALERIRAHASAVLLRLTVSNSQCLHLHVATVRVHAIVAICEHPASAQECNVCDFMDARVEPSSRPRFAIGSVTYDCCSSVQQGVCAGTAPEHGNSFR